MISNHGQHTPRPYIPPVGAVATLRIDGHEVGRVTVQGWDSSWAFGRFTPLEAFSAYAPLFGVWSLIMHDDEDAPLHANAAAVLADAERRMDALHVEICFPEHEQPIPIGQLNIDGELVEWKVL